MRLLRGSQVITILRFKQQPRGNRIAIDGLSRAFEQFTYSASPSDNIAKLSSHGYFKMRTRSSSKATKNTGIHQPSGRRGKDISTPSNKSRRKKCAPCHQTRRPVYPFCPCPLNFTVYFRRSRHSV